MGKPLPRAGTRVGGGHGRLSGPRWVEGVLHPEARPGPRVPWAGVALDKRHRFRNMQFLSVTLFVPRC